MGAKMFDPAKCKPDVLDRFWTHVDRSGTCWTWTGSKTHNGYGRFAVHVGCNMRAHRFIDYALNGPHHEGEWTLHTCDNPACVRPSHLFRGNALTNQQDMKAKGRERKRHGDTHPNAKLTTEDVIQLRTMYAEGYQRKEIAETLGISRSTVEGIIRGQHWKHVGEGV